MSDHPQSRKPAAFRLDDPHVVVTPQRASAGAPSPRRRDARDTVVVIPEPDADAYPALAPRSRRGRFAWGMLFVAALAVLVLLGLGLAATRLVEDLFGRAQWLGALGLAIAVVAATALVAVIVHEIIGLARLNTVEKLRQRAASAIAADDRDAARAVVRDLIGLTRAEPRLARARMAMTGHVDDIIDGADLLRVAERELMAPLDQEARGLVAAAAKRMSIVTAVSPRAAVDMIFVLVTALGLVRRLADLYGGRPGTLGLIRLVRHIVAHLALTGGMAAGDSLIQQLLGHGVAARLSARLGEGVLNGLLTARLGLAAIEAARPLPFTALPRPALGDLAASLVRRRDAETPELDLGDDRGRPDS